MRRSVMRDVHGSDGKQKETVWFLFIHEIIIG